MAKASKPKKKGYVLNGDHDKATKEKPGKKKSNDQDQDQSTTVQGNTITAAKDGSISCEPNE